MAENVLAYIINTSSITTECIKKTEQIGNRSQICKAADVMKFLVQIDYFGTYDVE